MSLAKITRDHNTIRHWAEVRGGRPSAVRQMRSGGDPGILRLDFDPRDDSLDPLSWDEFFKRFDSTRLSFLYQEETGDGKKRRFYKLIEERH
jgi:hypothetical protein